MDELYQAKRVFLGRTTGSSTFYVNRLRDNRTIRLTWHSRATNSCSQINQLSRIISPVLLMRADRLNFVEFPSVEFISSPKDRRRYEANIRPDQFSTVSHFYMSVMRRERVLPRPRRVKYVLNAYSIIVINNCICILSWYISL